MSKSNDLKFSDEHLRASIAFHAKDIAETLIDYGYALRNIEPGDATRYEVLCALNGLDRLVYVAVVNFSSSSGNGMYGYNLDSFSVPEYVMEKSGIRARGSANVMADLINEIKVHLHKLDAEPNRLNTLTRRLNHG